jgi:hypothetical protein
MDSMTITFHYGGALVSQDTFGRTAICGVDINDEHLNFTILQWADTYVEALTLVEVIFGDDD